MFQNPESVFQSTPGGSTVLSGKGPEIVSNVQKVVISGIVSERRMHPGSGRG